MDSILTSIKKLLGIAEDYEHFDTDIIIHINSVLSILHQLGVGPVAGFSITGKDDNWSDFLTDEDPRLNDVKSYMHIKVKLMFDPPTSSAVISCMETITKELEWRICVAADPTEVEATD